MNEFATKQDLYRLKVARLAPQYEYKNEKILLFANSVYIPGTDDARDVIQDIKVRTVAWDYTQEYPDGWPVHAGFRAAAFNVLKMLHEPLITVGNGPLRIVGHSKGGAVAILVGLALLQMGYFVRVLTFGAPQVSPVSRELPLKQIVAEGDPVPGLIPWKPLVEPMIVGQDHVLRPRIVNHVIDHYIRVV